MPGQAATPRRHEPEVLHDNFMAKVPSVLGEITAPKFSGTVNYTIGNGAQRQQAIYNFPKREAMLMAMSYSTKLQAKVYPRAGCPLRGKPLKPPSARR